MKRHLLIMRHAKSSWKSGASTDHERPLNARGRRDAPRIADALLQRKLSPDVVISSDAFRTRETWERMEAAFPEPEVRFTRSLYHAGLDVIVEHVSKVAEDAETVLVLGHNPGLEDAVDSLCGEYVRMTTGNVVILEPLDPDSWSSAVADGRWRLVEVIRPREL